MRPSISIPILIPLGLILLTGCGGGKQQVSSAELVQKGDQICTDARDRFNQVQAEPPANASAAADQTSELIDELHAEVSDLRDLEPPEAQRPAYGRYLDAQDRTVDVFERGKDAADNQDSAAYGAAQAEVVKGAPERQKLAKALGFAVCSKPPGPVA